MARLEIGNKTTSSNSRPLVPPCSDVGLRKSSLATTLELYSKSDWKNSSIFENDLCTAIANAPAPIDALEIWQSEDEDWTDHFVLPACFWNLAPSLKTIIINGPIYIVSPPTGTSDPLFALFNPNLKLLRLNNARFYNRATQNGANGSTYIVNWSSFFDLAWVPTAVVRLQNSNLGGEIAPIGRQITELNLSGNRINGTIGANFLNRPPGAVDRFRFNLRNNLISGPIPEGILTFQSVANGDYALLLGNNRLTGTIPPKLLMVAGLDGAYLEVDLSFNQFTGDLPWFNTTYNTLQTLTVDFGGNRLSGPSSLETIFESLVAPQLESISLDISYNNYVGSIPQFFEHTNLPVIDLIELYLSNNKFSGAVPSPVITGTFGVARSVILDLSSNMLSGPVPSSLAPVAYALEAVQIRLTNNSLQGTVPPTITAHFPSIELYLAHNDITGPLPVLTSEANYLRLDLSSNPIGGSIPPTFFAISSVAHQFYVTMANCSFTGTVPALPTSTYWGVNLASNELSEVDIAAMVLSQYDMDFNEVSLNLTNNQLQGNITLPDVATVSSPVRFEIDLSVNNFTVLDAGNAITYLTYLSVSYNPELTGTLPSTFFDSASRAYFSFFAANTSIGGDLPLITNDDYVVDLDLSYTHINFCTARPAWDSFSPLQLCLLYDTNVSECSSLYPPICLSAPLPPTAEPVATPPSTTPTAPLAPSAGPNQPLQPTDPVEPVTPGVPTPPTGNAPVDPPTSAGSILTGGVTAIVVSALIMMGL